MKNKRPHPWPYVLLMVGSAIVLLACSAIILLSNVEAP